MTHSEKVLQILRSVGEKGIHSFDLGHSVGTWRVAARIHDLKKRGHNIVSVPEPKGNMVGCRYFLNEITK